MLAAQIALIELTAADEVQEEAEAQSQRKENDKVIYIQTCNNGDGVGRNYGNSVEARLKYY